LALPLVPIGAGCGGGGGGGNDAGVQPAFPPTFTNINKNIFQISCTLSDCHTTGAGPPVGNLDLTDNPYFALLGDGGVPAVNIGTPYNYDYNGMLLVAAGNPDNSLLYQKLNAGQGAVAGCTQTDAGACQYGQHMPNVEGEVLSPPYLEAVREWIADGAQND
jgi:hypothetical protein